jgi:hypothetical protein
MNSEKFLGSPPKAKGRIPSSVIFDDVSGGSLSPSPLKSPAKRPARIENVSSLAVPSLTPIATNSKTSASVAAFSGLAGTVQHDDGLLYLSGFGNSFESECLPGALPRGRNNPRQVPFNLYTEQLSGTGFTAPRKENRRTWLYRIQPSVTGVGPTSPAKAPYPRYFGGANPIECEPEVNPLRWTPLGLELNENSSALQRDFVSGMRLMCQAGHLHVCRSSEYAYLEEQFFQH